MKPNYSSSSPPPTSISSSPNSETRNWLHLPRDVTAMILLKVGLIDVLNNAQLVCAQWRSISKDPHLWRVIDMHGWCSCEQFDLMKLCCHAIDRSQGSLISISLTYFGSDDLLHYIADFASHLQQLRIRCCPDISDEGLSEVAKQLRCLEELDVSIGKFSENSVEAIGRCCPLLKSLKFNIQKYGLDDKVAFAIAQTMPNLRHLQLFRNGVTNEGLLAILDGCPRLESLDLRECFNVDLGGSLGRRCAEQIKDLLKPGDTFDDYIFSYVRAMQPEVYLSDDDSDEYPFDYDDYDEDPLD